MSAIPEEVLAIGRAGIEAACVLIILALIASVVASLAFVVMGVDMRRRAILLTGVVGTPIHELSHAVTALLFGMRVHHINLFQPDPQSPQLGYVSFSYSRERLLHRVGLFFVGLAPLLVGASLVALILGYSGIEISDPGLPSLPEAWDAFSRTHDAMLQALISGWPGMGLAFLAAAIALHSAPSWADMRHAGVGLLTGMTALIFFLLPVVYLLGLLGVDPSGGLTRSVDWMLAAIMDTCLIMIWFGMAVGVAFLPVRVAVAAVRSLRSPQTLA